ncbi:hypothetical protein Salat_1087400 [Sesamum alatum]|uniref:Uncharacterized protein n=1 Tax=Sesamum alatum TaxID=300844 RepID=A0AAE2CST3_9LAMI|nr:hypothetical protein Salat_1087400 [Sesamum alatum]
MNHFQIATFGHWNPSLLSQIQATTANIVPDGYYYQCQMFYYKNGLVKWKRPSLTAWSSMQSQQNKRAKCYCNAYEDLCEQLCILFDKPNNAQDDVIDADRTDALGNEVVPVDPIHEAGPSDPPNEALHDEPVPTAVGIPSPVLFISDSSDSSSSMWRDLEEYTQATALQILFCPH